MNKEVWSEEYDDVFEGECEYCGDNTLVRDCLDPFCLEINEEEVPMGLVCAQCYQNRADDI